VIPRINSQFRARRTALGLTQADVARRGGLQQRQVSVFEQGGEVTLSTLLKLARALDLELLPVPRELGAQVETLLRAKPAAPAATAPMSLLDRYRVIDEGDPSNG